MPVIIIIIAIGIYTVVYLVVVDDAVEYLQLIKQHVRLSISHVWHNIQTHHYRVMLSMSAAYAVAISLSVCLSVRPSVCHTPVFCRNGSTYHQTFITFEQPHHASFKRLT